MAWGVPDNPELSEENWLSYVFEGPHSLFLKGACVVWNEKCLSYTHASKTAWGGSFGIWRRYREVLASWRITSLGSRL